MTDKEIITALECCGDELHFCAVCPQYLHDNDNDYCSEDLHKQALDLINRQQAEIERLQKYNTEVAYKHYNDGIKEFAERLKQLERFTTSDHYWIDNLVKEMLGETK